jgi:hypothetical protein
MLPHGVHENEVLVARPDRSRDRPAGYSDETEYGDDYELPRLFAADGLDPVCSAAARSVAATLAIAAVL